MRDRVGEEMQGAGEEVVRVGGIPEEGVDDLREDVVRKVQEASLFFFFSSPRSSSLSSARRTSPPVSRCCEIRSYVHFHLILSLSDFLPVYSGSRPPPIIHSFSLFPTYIYHSSPFHISSVLASSIPVVY